MTDESASSRIRYPETVVLRPGRSYGVHLLLMCLGLVGVGCWIAFWEMRIGLIFIVIFGVGSLLGVLNLLPGSSGLVVMREGFGIRVLYRMQFLEWKDVEGFGFFTESQQQGGRTLVGFNVVQKHTGLWAYLNKPLYGYAHALPDCYGYTAHDLAWTLNRYRKDALADQANTAEKSTANLP